MKLSWLLSAALAATLAAPAAAANREERVHFVRGTSSAVLRGEIRGYDFADYLVGARAGQHLSVQLTRASGPGFFLVRAPGSEDNLFDGSTSGDRFETALPAYGDYLIRVFMMRSAARRNERTVYRLRVEIR